MEGKVLKKSIIFILLLIFSTTIGATCGGCSSGNNNGDDTKYSLTVWHVFDDEEVIQDIINNYEKQNPNVEINYVKKDYTEYEEQTTDALAAGKGPDIWLIRNDWVYKHYDKLEPMSSGLLKKTSKDERTDLEIYEQTYPDIAVDDCVIDEKIYGIPLSIDTLALYYNKDHFSEKRKELYVQKNNNDAKLFQFSPNNWEEVLKMSKILTNKDGAGNITRAGIALGTAKNVDNASDILAALMLQNKTNMSSADKLTATFNLPVNKETGEPVYSGTEALNFYTSFSNTSKENYMWNDSMPNSVDAFIQGKASMIIDYGFIRERLEQEAPNLKYDIGPLPQISGATSSIDYASYWVETVTNNAKNPAQAWKFIKFLKQSDASYQSGTNRPPADRINELAIPDTKVRNQDNNSPFEYQPMSAAYWYKGKYPLKVDNAFYNMIQDVIVNKVPLQKSIDKAAAVVTELYKISTDNYSTDTDNNTTQ